MLRAEMSPTSPNVQQYTKKSQKACRNESAQLRQSKKSPGVNFGCFTSSFKSWRLWDNQCSTETKTGNRRSDLHSFLCPLLTTPIVLRKVICILLYAFDEFQYVPMICEVFFTRERDRHWLAVNYVRIFFQTVLELERRSRRQDWDERSNHQS